MQGYHARFTGGPLDRATFGRIAAPQPTAQHLSYATSTRRAEARQVEPQATEPKLSPAATLRQLGAAKSWSCKNARAAHQNATSRTSIQRSEGISYERAPSRQELTQIYSDVTDQHWQVF